MRDQLLVQIGKGIRARRKVLGLSQEELADRAGLHRTYIGAVERAEQNVTILSLSHIASALGCSVADLIPQP